MVPLRMKGVRCASLEDVRANFDFTNAKDYLVQGRLSQWVRELGENDLADELDELKVADYGDQTMMDNFIGIFSLPVESAPSGSGAPKPDHSKTVNDIRRELEDPEYPEIALPEPEFVPELLDLLHEYFEQWSEELREASGKAVRGRWELDLSELPSCWPFVNCAELLHQMISPEEKAVWDFFDLPEEISWTSAARPEQCEKSKAIAAYYVLIAEIEYRAKKLSGRSNKGSAS